MIDMLLMEKQGRNKIMDVRAKRQYEIGSDNYFIEAKLKRGGLKDERDEVEAPTVH